MFLLIAVAAFLFLLPAGARAKPGKPDGPEERKSRAFFGAGVAVGLEPDSSEANLALRFGSVRRLGRGFGAGWEGAIHDLYSEGDPVYGGALVLFRLGAVLEYLPPFPRKTRPVLFAGAGWYSWGRRGGCGDRICWPWRDSVRVDALGAWAGAGLRTPYGWGRDLSFEARLHPWSNRKETWTFLDVTVSVGW